MNGKPEQDDALLRELVHLRQRIAELESAEVEGRQTRRAARARERELKQHQEYLEALIERRTEELRRAQDAMLRQERLATMGKLAGTISHEIRNPLGVIDSSAYYLQTHLRGADEHTRRHLQRIQASVRNCTVIIESLLRLTRPEELAVQRFDLTEYVIRTIEGASLPGTIDIARRFPPQPVPIDADPEQLRLALLNIVRNAVEAMESEGTLTITVECPDDREVEVSLADTGPGIRPEHLPSIFEPLFSTKTRGIGLGLSLARTVAEKHGGTIEAGSEPGHGTRITIRLPIAEA